MHENHGKENYRRLFLFNILFCPNIPPKWAFRIMSENNHLLLWSSCLCPPQNSHRKPNFKVTPLALMTGTSALIQEGHTAPWALLPWEDTTSLCNLEKGSHSALLAGTLHLRLAASRTMRNKFLLFISYSFCCILLQQPAQTDTYFLASVAMATQVTL